MASISSSPSPPFWCLPSLRCFTSSSFGLFLPGPSPLFPLFTPYSASSLLARWYSPFFVLLHYPLRLTCVLQTSWSSLSNDSLHLYLLPYRLLHICSALLAHHPLRLSCFHKAAAVLARLLPTPVTEVKHTAWNLRGQTGGSCIIFPSRPFLCADTRHSGLFDL